MAAPRHVLLELDEQGDLHSVGEESDAEEPRGDARRETPESRPESPDGPPGPDRSDDGAQFIASRFWGVSWHRESKKWKAAYRDADGKTRYIGHFDDEEEAARARDQAIRDAGLQGKRHMNVDATGALVPKRSGAPSRFDQARERSAVVAPDPAHDPTAPTSKFWGVSWENKSRRWKANYNDADGKNRHLGLYDTQEAAAHAVNAAIRRAGLEGRRKTNPVVDGQLVPRALKARGHGPEYLRDRKRGRHDESPAATPSTRARRPRRAAAN